MLPSSRRVMGFVIKGLSSLTQIMGEKRGLFSSAKKIMRVLYTAVSEVAIRVSSRAQAFA